ERILLEAERRPRREEKRDAGRDRPGMVVIKVRGNDAAKHQLELLIPRDEGEILADLVHSDGEFLQSARSLGGVGRWRCLGGRCGGSVGGVAWGGGAVVAGCAGCAACGSSPGPPTFRREPNWVCPCATPESAQSASTIPYRDMAKVLPALNRGQAGAIGAIHV